MANDVIAQVGYEKRADNSPDMTKVALLLCGVGVAARSFTTIDWKSLADAINAAHAAEMDELRELVLRTIESVVPPWVTAEEGRDSYDIVARSTTAAIKRAVRRVFNMGERGDVPLEATPLDKAIKEQPECEKPSTSSDSCHGF